MTDLVAHYLANTGMHAVLVLASADSASIRLTTSNTTAVRLTAGVTVARAWWVQDEALAIRAAEYCYEIAAANGVHRQARWLRLPATEAAGLVAAAITRMGITVATDKAMRKQAQAVVDAIEADLAERRRAGDLKSVNREYAEHRLKTLGRGERAPTYGDYMLALTRRMVGEAGRRNEA